MRFNRIFPLFLSQVILTGTTYAEVYAGLETGAVFVEVDGTNFRPITAGVNVGFRQKDGYGVGFIGRTGITSDDESGVELELNYQASLYANMRKPFSDRAYLSLGVGYTTTQLDSSLNGSDFPGTQDYNGPAFRASLEESLKSYQDVILSLSYEYHYLDSEVAIQSANLGVSYEF